MPSFDSDIVVDIFPPLLRIESIIDRLTHTDEQFISRNEDNISKCVHQITHTFLAQYIKNDIYDR